MSTVDGLATFEARLAARTMRIGVVGLGYTGLPLAMGFATSGFCVTGVDLDADKVDAVNRGESYLPDLTDHEVREASTDRLFAVTEPAALDGAEVVILCVPTPVTRRGTADLSYVQAAVESVLPHLRTGALLVLQSTVPVGTTAGIARTVTERTGLVAGRDYFLATAPERVDPANTNGWNLANTPKLVGGVDAESTRRARLLFEQVCARVTAVSAAEVAELSKVYENTFRLVNIALALEFADLCRSLGVPAREVIDAAATKPFGFLAHYPGPGVGGECIPVDPLFLLERAEREGVELALVGAAHRRIADRPHQVVGRLAELLAGQGGKLAGTRVLLVGVSYKPGVGDLRNAPALDIVRDLRAAGAELSYTDPMVPGLTVDGRPVAEVPFSAEQLAAHDVAVLVTPHPGLLAAAVWAAAPLVIDTYGVLPAAAKVVVL
ncbi:nucleotide sugar dehydrogenase [Streptomyces sp. NBC_01190]|uniref:nucleotide sugar dehydrogenase n=1 Tax=Streptomyces sp. NBC_01190 TaxID=2903767 RepID=UPI00386A310A|nr:nucleotide sugar dehydrogenase [Streptomyces sp. NBC_01190]